jgi:signal transduction histidine kinase
MKLSFQQRLAWSFIVVFTLFTAGVVVFEGQRIRRYKTDALEERLDAYAGEIERLGSVGAPLDELVGLMPHDLRVTLIDRDGVVVYDNRLPVSSMDNHSDRPEVKSAATDGSGTSIRLSDSAGEKYLYYAKDSGGEVVVRVALPYNIEVQSLLKPDNAFFYFVVALFVVGLLFIVCLGRYFGASVKRLREHEAREKTRRLKHEMTGNIAHELRTPVTSIRGFLEIVLGNELDEGRRRQYLQRAYTQTQTLSALISDMSLLARIDEKQGAFEFTGIEAATLIEKVRSDASKGLVEKNIHFTTDIPAGLVFRGNESLLYSVLRNLTDNVIAHAGEGIEIRITAEVVEGSSSGSSSGGGSGSSPGGGSGSGRPIRDRGRMARISFSDTGRGIANEGHLERLFERFYRVNEGRTRDTGGSGLGLSIVKNTVELHGGTIAVRGNKPSGLEFIFVLPIQ